jgi:hypothetical protein
MARPKGTRRGGGHRSKAESMTGAKENAVETRKASATGELPLPKPDRIQLHRATVKGLKDKLETLKGHLRKAYQTAKADHVSKELLNDLDRLERGDPAEFRAYLESLGVGLKAIDAPFQLNIFDAVYASPVEAAAAKGRQDAEAGRFAENTFPEGSLEDEAYQEAYMKVQEGRVVKMAPTNGRAASDVEMAA